MANPDEIIMTFDEFLATAETSDLFQQVAQEIAHEQDQQVMIETARRDEEWSFLANQVVGGEISMLAHPSS